MRLKIAARQSDLARLQAYQVGDALCMAHPGLQVEYQFRASLGDINLHDPLWKMPEKGVFTEDFVGDLLDARADLVVHSWKDLPTADRGPTEIVATMPRADLRDLFLFRRDRWDDAKRTGRLRILTSSPRRIHNLEPFFKQYLPFEVGELSFETVRGNIPTRLGKMFSQDVDGLIVAKAALDRLLSVGREEFNEVKASLRRQIQDCLWMVLPLTENPSAAAQGALAVEIRRDRDDVRSLLKALHCPETFATATREREILSAYGGGCHQKIGISILRRAFGDVVYLRGLTDAGQVLDSVRLEGSRSVPPAESEAALWPGQPSEGRWFQREALPKNDWADAIQAPFVWVARHTALPEGAHLAADSIVWTAGLETWRKLASRGIWVSGSSEGIGERESSRIEALVGRAPDWVKLTHETGRAVDGTRQVATYRLVPLSDKPNLHGKTHFYWMSGSSFAEALKSYPEIRNGIHACGPGHTYDTLARLLGGTDRLYVCLNYEDWRRQVAPSV